MSSPKPSPTCNMIIVIVIILFGVMILMMMVVVVVVTTTMRVDVESAHVTLAVEQIVRLSKPVLACIV